MGDNQSSLISSWFGFIILEVKERLSSPASFTTPHACEKMGVESQWMEAIGMKCIGVRYIAAIWCP